MNGQKKTEYSSSCYTLKSRHVQHINNLNLINVKQKVNESLNKLKLISLFTEYRLDAKIKYLEKSNLAENCYKCHTEVKKKVLLLFVY